MQHEQDGAVKGYFDRTDFFAGKPIYWLFVNAVLNYALLMDSSEDKLPCDKAMLDAYKEDKITLEFIQGYLAARRIFVSSVRVNSEGEVAFSITRAETLRPRPEPDF